MKKKILVFLILCSAAVLQADDGTAHQNFGDFTLWGIDFDMGGEIRTRSAYLNNYDMDYETADGSIAWDARGRLGLKVTWDSPFYVNSLLEWGNVEFTQEDLSFGDVLDLEMKELYLGFQENSFKMKAGIIDINTPGNYVYDSDEWGLQGKYDFDFLKLKTFYSAANLTEGNNESTQPLEYMDHLFYLGVNQDTLLDLDLWSMFYHGDTEELTYNSCWLGFETAGQINDFSIEAVYTYNFGKVVTYALPLSAHFTRIKLKLEPNKRNTIFTRFNMTSGSDGSLDTLGQFQTLDGEGNLDTGLGLLFGGSPYSSQAYFDDESLSIVSNNLSDGVISYNDPGLLIYELGYRYEFKHIMPLDLETEFILGAANTGDLFRGDGYFYSLIGLVADIHNSLQLSDGLEFDLSLSYLLAGNAFNAVYELNTGETLSLEDSSMKIDCQLKYSF
ncbi:MAG: hypothetical protein PQJ58_11230 [Spirochaetales bacterium]|nr:hypothetical protein [Spirochaetales bacterium]